MTVWRYSKLTDAEAEEDVDSVPAQTLRKYRIVCGLLFFLNILICIAWYASGSDCTRPKLVYSPARSAIHYEKRRLWRDIDHNKYTGAPRPEHDEAWRELIEPITIKISKAELVKMNKTETSIELIDGSGFIAEPAVYHELHCIKRIRRHLYLDHYYPNMTEDQRLREGPHIDHCLEYLREATMCRGDMSLATYRWAAGKPFSHVYSDHECVNWDSLDTWARERMVDMSDYSILDHSGV